MQYTLAKATFDQVWLTYLLYLLNDSILAYLSDYLHTLSLIHGPYILSLNIANWSCYYSQLLNTHIAHLRGETVYVNFLVTASCSLNISVVYFCN